MEYCKSFAGEISLPSAWTCTLPTEAQWEYACRAGTRTVFHFGDSANGVKANIDGNIPFGTDETGPSVGGPRPVGSYPSNAWGIHDMHGNVWEWCRDWYQGDYYEDGQIDPSGPETGDRKIARGASFANQGGAARAAWRHTFEPDMSSPFVGFRAVIAPVTPALRQQ